MIYFKSSYALITLKFSPTFKKEYQLLVLIFRTIIANLVHNAIVLGPSILRQSKLCRTKSSVILRAHFRRLVY